MTQHPALTDERLQHGANYAELVQDFTPQLIGENPAACITRFKAAVDDIYIPNDPALWIINPKNIVDTGAYRLYVFRFDSNLEAEPQEVIVLAYRADFASVDVAQMFNDMDQILMTLTGGKGLRNPVPIRMWEGCVACSFHYNAATWG